MILCVRQSSAMAWFTLLCLSFAAGNGYSAAPRELYVSPTLGDDDPARLGSPTEPLASLQRAFDLARPILADDGQVKITLLAGIYTQGGTLDVGGDEREGTLVIEAVSDSGVTFSQARPVEGWRLAEDGFFEVSAEQPPAMVVLGGTLFLEPSSSRIDSDSFYFTYGSGKARVQVGDEIDPRTREVTVVESTPGPLIKLVGLRSLLVKNLRFEQIGSESALAIENIRIASLERLNFQWLRGDGIVTEAVNTVEIAGVNLRSVGHRAVVARKATNVGLKTCNIEFCGWNRQGAGIRAITREIAVFADIRNLFLEFSRFSENFGAGATLVNCSNVTINRLLVFVNRGHGLFFESPSLNVLLNDSELAGNRANGIFLRTEVATITGNIFYANRGWELAADDDISGFDYDLISVDGNIFQSGSERSGILLLGNSEGGNMLNFTGNLFYSGRPAEAFLIDGERLDFATWSSSLPEGHKSMWGDPLFFDPKKFEFNLRPQSPWFQRH